MLCVRYCLKNAFQPFSHKYNFASRLLCINADGYHRRCCRRRHYRCPVQPQKLYNNYYYQKFSTTKQMDRSNGGSPPNWPPPSSCRGMIQLDRDKFRRTVKIPMLDVSELSINSALPHLKHILFKMEHLKPMQTQSDGTRKLLLHPVTVRSWYDLPDDVRNLGITGSHLTWEDFEIKYENWKAEEILKSVLPENHESITSFSRIGHIIHVNLRDHLLPYKSLIGQVLMDKVPNTRAVVNKIQTIENTFRNFQLELLCGEPDYKVEVKENGVIFEFDFSTVYWNPRLATEHERIIKTLSQGDVFYDVFAGVGPFSIPAAKRKCTVLANDLNPESFKWLNQNAKRNKVGTAVSTFNKDGRDFILNDIRNDILRRWTEHKDDDDLFNKGEYKMHITMNLPAMAVEFLDAFRGLISSDVMKTTIRRIYPIVHVYCFAKGDNLKQLARNLAEHHLGIKFGDNLEGIHFVRNVAPNKDMYRVSFYLNEEILSSKKENIDAIGDGIDNTLKRSAKVEVEDEPIIKKAM